MSSRAARTVLIREGQPIDMIYIILDGVFAVSVAALKGREVARLMLGEVVGEISFVDSRPPSATVQAVVDSRVLAIPRRQLAAKLEHDTGFAGRFYRALAVFLADRLRSATSRLGYSQDEPLVDDAEYELDPEVLDQGSLAGARFDWMLRCLQSE